MSGSVFWDPAYQEQVPQPVRVYVPDRDEVITLPCADPLGWRACESCGLGDHMPRPAPPGALCAYCAELAWIRCRPGPAVPPDLPRIAFLIMLMTLAMLAVLWALGVIA